MPDIFMPRFDNMGRSATLPCIIEMRKATVSLLLAGASAAPFWAAEGGDTYRTNSKSISVDYRQIGAVSLPCAGHSEESSSLSSCMQVFGCMSCFVAGCH